MMELKKPKILFILHAYQNHGGTEEHTKLLVKNISNQYDTAIIARSGDEILFIVNNSIKNKYPATRLNWPVTPINDIDCENALDAVIQTFSPDLIHIQHFSNWHLSIFDQVARYKIPIILSLHDYYLLTPFFTNQYNATIAMNSQEHSKKLYGGDITQYLQKRFEYLKNSIKLVDKIITPSNYLKMTIDGKCNCNCHVIEHGIEKIEHIKSRDGSSLDFGYIGSLIPQKGWNILRDAFRSVRERLPGSTLHFFGDGDGVNPEEKQNESQILFHGRYEQSDLPYILSKFDIGIIPSIFEETYCLTLSELWEGKKPVIASDIGALGERVIQHSSGLKFMPGDTKQLADAIVWFKENNSWKSWNLPIPRKADQMSEEYVECYQSLLRI